MLIRKLLRCGIPEMAIVRDEIKVTKLSKRSCKTNGW